MDIKRFFMALPAVATMLLAASCSNQEIENIEATQASQKHSIPFEAVVNSPVQTRGTLNAAGDAYEFQTGDRLFVVGGNANTTITAELTLNPADAGKTTGARFTGTLDYTGDAPTDETGLSAWLKGVNDQLLPATAAALAAANGQVTFPATAIAASPAEAVKKYSYFFPMSMVTYGNPSFTLYQFSSFIDFNIALEDGTAVGDVLPVTITNGGSVVRTGTVTATDDGFGGVTARFTAAFMGYGADQFAASTTLSSATVTLGTKSPISFGGTTELNQNKIYQVRKGYYEAGAKYTLTANATVMGNPVQKELTDETLPISTTVATLLGTYSSAASFVTSAVVTSGENVTLGTFSAGDTPVTVSKSGTSTIKLTTSGFGDIIVTVTVAKQAAPAATDLSTITEPYTAQNGETLTGTLGANVKISIADGATVTLNNVTINGTNDSNYEWAGITCLGDATIILSGTNTVKGFYGDYPGIQAAAGKTLIINGTGSLAASSYGWGAGIGGGSGSGAACGNIEIQGGTITATSGEYGAGIGGGNNSSWGNITISGGTVTATGGWRGAGIGGGRKGLSDVSCGNILISGGTVTATGGEDAAGIGGGRGYNSGILSSCGTITITTDVTKVTATKGEYATNSIGAGNVGTCGTVTIGGNVGAITDSPYTYQP